MGSDAVVTENASLDGRLSTRIRWARGGYVVVAGLFVVCVLIQVFIAGMAVFVDPENWSLHANFVHVFEFLPLVMLVLAFLGRLSQGLKLLPAVLFVLLIVQYATALGFSDSVVAALHPVNALVIFGIAVMAIRRAWRALSEPAETTK